MECVLLLPQQTQEALEGREEELTKASEGQRLLEEKVAQQNGELEEGRGRLLALEVRTNSREVCECQKASVAAWIGLF